jgi:broad specificity phosphatase PhoE
MSGSFLRVLLVRHGQSLNNVLAEQSSTSYEQSRVPDAPLTSLGRAQASALAPALASAAAPRAAAVSGAAPAAGAVRRETAAAAPALSAVYCSAMDRALATAVLATAQVPHLRPRVWPSLCEVGGLFDFVYDSSRRVVGDVGVRGLGRAAIAEAYPAAALPPAAAGGGAADDLFALRDDGWFGLPRRESAAEGDARVRRVLAELVRAAAELAAGADAADAAFDVRAALRGGGGGGGGGGGAAAAPTGKTSGSRGAALVGTTAIALVCHGDFIETFLRLACGGGALAGASSAPAHAAVPAEFCVHNCSISTVDIFASGAVRVARVNDVSHLLFAAAAAAAQDAAAGADFAPRYELVTGGCIV